ncbi:hypothetical protein METBIDRAFT_36026 [Metschnikowia bicuspidata var. bicuspidata NRRL YB-4993]|uniref:Mannosyltransferase n=1 Tax=Metschnikowia bicuspidata var. bicuspidata NRRL YB-4993 TaxID=869754 RepID=A0A1A0HK47_9ASCO|nr:hypothetical protein METBIDRAFT_36026 [Metschnikowia bicuspidata var. bicuspidata NRRL YB-4993]OBA24376.1 hypothetical protein METBIDRAFT_36026 [Metschnikowia bicuspidata var. bicuspidata NRRL YB-4993]
MSFLSWRSVYFVSIGLRFVLALSNSYIHPDEHFQSFEVLAGRMFSLSTREPWEFGSLAPARSAVPLLVVYYLPLTIAQWLGLLPLQTWYLVRLVFMAISWMVTDWCLYKMLPTKQERIKAIYFVLTSFVSLVYQLHTFSNSIETVLVVLTVYFINELRFIRTLPEDQYKTSDIINASVAIGVLFAFGIFNRVTFPAFFVIPGFFLLQSSLKWMYLPIVTTCAFMTTAICCVLVDSCWFGETSISAILEHPWLWSQYVVTPYNNLVYNASFENLAQHGIHPFYTHILVNVPQILGPGLVLLLPRFRNSYWKTTPFLSAMSGLIFLSLVPHQELRFLIPIVPLLCACFDVAALESACQKHPLFLSCVMNAWLIFNILMGTMMGVLHQGGVVPALDFLHENPQYSSPGNALIWWRTYSPPTWMLDQKMGNLQIVSVDENTLFLSCDLDSRIGKASIDAMGMEAGKLQELIKSVSARYPRVYLITPIASFSHKFNTSQFEEIWRYNSHVDLDHFDLSRLQSFQPGLAIYNLL